MECADLSALFYSHPPQISFAKVLNALSFVASAPQMPDTPTGLESTVGDHDGQIDLSWDPVSGAKSYVIQQSADPPTTTSWTHDSTSTKSSATVDGLTSGTRYWFRVSAVGPRGQSGWSDPATKIAP